MEYDRRSVPDGPEGQWPHWFMGTHPISGARLDQRSEASNSGTVSYSVYWIDSHSHEMFPFVSFTFVHT